MATDNTRERLRHAITMLPEGVDLDEKLMALHAELRRMGVTGVHGTRRTLRRWVVDGRGMPPPYWLGLAADFLGVEPLWLETGNGVMMAKGRKVRSAPPKGVEPTAEKPEAPPEPVAVKKRPKVLTEAQRLRKVQLEALGKKAAAEKDQPPPVPKGKKPEPEVSIPMRADVHGSNAKTIINFLEKTTSVEPVKAILEHEPSNPTYKGGRQGVLKAATARLAELTSG